MAKRTPRRLAQADAIALALLGAVFVVVAVLLVQALVALRGRDRVVASTLEDFAAFAAERIAAELDATFSATFLDQIAVSRAVHQARQRGAYPDPGLGATYRIPPGAVPAHFTIEDGRMFVEGTVDEEAMAWALSEVVAHARDVYPRPAPYAMLRRGAPHASQAVVYRREGREGSEEIYGFFVLFEAFERYYRSILATTPVLPRSLEDDVQAADVLGVELAFPQRPEPLHARAAPLGTEVVRGEAFAAKAGRMAVRVVLDAGRTRALLGGARAWDVPLFVALSTLTLGLFGAALATSRRASRLSRMREAFIENASHDLRTPLAQIRMFSETLLLGRLDDPSERRRSLEIIRQQTAHLESLVDNVLMATVRGEAQVRPRPTEVEPVVRATLDALEPAAERAGTHVALAVSGDTEACVDPATLRRILMNLVDNAIQYGPAGQTVTVRVRVAAEGVEIVVEDQGPGVPRRDRARVWERFVRLEGEHASSSGTGLGLSVVRDLAERHGGSVHFGEGEKGAQVTVTLSAAAHGEGTPS